MRCTSSFNAKKPQPFPAEMRLFLPLIEKEGLYRKRQRLSNDYIQNLDSNRGTIEPTGGDPQLIRLAPSVLAFAYAIIAGLGILGAVPHHI